MTQRILLASLMIAGVMACDVIYGKPPKKPPIPQIPNNQLKPGAEIVLPLPELGKSERSGREEPVKMRLHLPENYNPK